MQYEDSESSQDLDWLSAVVQPAHAQRDVLVDAARTALDKLAEQVNLILSCCVVEMISCTHQ